MESEKTVIFAVVLPDLLDIARKAMWTQKHNALEKKKSSYPTIFATNLRPNPVHPHRLFDSRPVDQRESSRNGSNMSEPIWPWMTLTTFPLKSIMTVRERTYQDVPLAPVSPIFFTRLEVEQSASKNE
jgi:hypothetical protein